MGCSQNKNAYLRSSFEALSKNIDMDKFNQLLINNGGQLPKQIQLTLEEQQDIKLTLEDLKNQNLKLEQVTSSTRSQFETAQASDVPPINQPYQANYHIQNKNSQNLNQLLNALNKAVNEQQIPQNDRGASNSENIPNANKNSYLSNTSLNTILGQPVNDDSSILSNPAISNGCSHAIKGYENQSSRNSAVVNDSAMPDMNKKSNESQQAYNVNKENQDKNLSKDPLQNQSFASYFSSSESNINQFGNINNNSNITPSEKNSFLMCNSICERNKRMINNTSVQSQPVTREDIEKRALIEKDFNVIDVKSVQVTPRNSTQKPDSIYIQQKNSINCQKYNEKKDQQTPTLKHHHAITPSCSPMKLQQPQTPIQQRKAEHKPNTPLQYKLNCQQSQMAIDKPQSQILIKNQVNDKKSTNTSLIDQDASLIKQPLTPSSINYGSSTRALTENFSSSNILDPTYKNYRTLRTQENLTDRLETANNQLSTPISNYQNKTLADLDCTPSPNFTRNAETQNCLTSNSPINANNLTQTNFENTFSTTSATIPSTFQQYLQDQNHNTEKSQMLKNIKSSKDSQQCLVEKKIDNGLNTSRNQLPVNQYLLYSNTLPLTPNKSLKIDPSLLKTPTGNEQLQHNQPSSSLMLTPLQNQQLNTSLINQSREATPIAKFNFNNSSNNIYTDSSLTLPTTPTPRANNESVRNKFQQLKKIVGVRKTSNHDIASQLQIESLNQQSKNNRTYLDDEKQQSNNASHHYKNMSMRQSPTKSKTTPDQIQQQKQQSIVSQNNKTLPPTINSINFKIPISTNNNVRNENSQNHQRNLTYHTSSSTNNDNNNKVPTPTNNEFTNFFKKNLINEETLHNQEQIQNENQTNMLASNNSTQRSNSNSNIQQSDTIQKYNSFENSQKLDNKSYLIVLEDSFKLSEQLDKKYEEINKKFEQILNHQDPPALIQKNTIPHQESTADPSSVQIPNQQSQFNKDVLKNFASSKRDLQRKSQVDSTIKQQGTAAIGKNSQQDQLPLQEQTVKIQSNQLVQVQPVIILSEQRQPCIPGSAAWVAKDNSSDIYNSNNGKQDQQYNSPEIQKIIKDLKKNIVKDIENLNTQKSEDNRNDEDTHIQLKSPSHQNTTQQQANVTSTANAELQPPSHIQGSARSTEFSNIEACSNSSNIEEDSYKINGNLFSDRNENKCILGEIMKKDVDAAKVKIDRRDKKFRFSFSLYNNCPNNGAIDNFDSSLSEIQEASNECIQNINKQQLPPIPDKLQQQVQSSSQQNIATLNPIPIVPCFSKSQQNIQINCGISEGESARKEEIKSCNKLFESIITQQPEEQTSRYKEENETPEKHVGEQQQQAHGGMTPCFLENTITGIKAITTIGNSSMVANQPQNDDLKQPDESVIAKSKVCKNLFVKKGEEASYELMDNFSELQLAEPCQTQQVQQSQVMNQQNDDDNNPNEEKDEIQILTKRSNQSYQIIETDQKEQIINNEEKQDKQHIQQNGDDIDNVILETLKTENSMDHSESEDDVDNVIQQEFASDKKEQESVDNDLNLQLIHYECQESNQKCVRASLAEDQEPQQATMIDQAQNKNIKQPEEISKSFQKEDEKSHQSQPVENINTVVNCDNSMASYDHNEQITLSESQIQQMEQKLKEQLQIEFEQLSIKFKSQLQMQLQQKNQQKQNEEVNILNNVQNNSETPQKYQQQIQKPEIEEKQISSDNNIAINQTGSLPISGELITGSQEIQKIKTKMVEYWNNICDEVFSSQKKQNSLIANSGSKQNLNTFDKTLDKEQSENGNQHQSQTLSKILENLETEPKCETNRTHEAEDEPCNNFVKNLSNEFDKQSKERISEYVIYSNNKDKDDSPPIKKDGPGHTQATTSAFIDPNRISFQSSASFMTTPQIPLINNQVPIISDKIIEEEKDQQNKTTDTNCQSQQQEKNIKRNESIQQTTNQNKLELSSLNDKLNSVSDHIQNLKRHSSSNSISSSRGGSFIINDNQNAGSITYTGGLNQSKSTNCLTKPIVTENPNKTITNTIPSASTILPNNQEGLFGRFLKQKELDNKSEKKLPNAQARGDSPKHQRCESEMFKLPTSKITFNEKPQYPASIYNVDKKKKMNLYINDYSNPEVAPGTTTTETPQFRAVNLLKNFQSAKNSSQKSKSQKKISFLQYKEMNLPKN